MDFLHGFSLMDSVGICWFLKNETKKCSLWRYLLTLYRRMLFFSLSCKSIDQLSVHCELLRQRRTFLSFNKQRNLNPFATESELKYQRFGLAEERLKIANL